MNNYYLLAARCIYGFLVLMPILTITYYAFKPPTKRSEFLLAGLYLMIMAAFLLVGLTVGVLYLSDIVKPAMTGQLSDKLTENDILQANNAKYFFMFLSFICTFIVAGIGINLFSHGITSTPSNADQDLLQKLISELNSLKKNLNWVRAFNIVQLIFIVLILLALILK